MIITVNQIYDFSALTSVDIKCSNCGSIKNCKINSIRSNVKRNGGEFRCISCRKKRDENSISSNSKWNEKIDVICSVCTKTYQISLNSKVTLERNGKLPRCQSCGNKQSHADGNYDHIYTDEFRQELRDRSRTDEMREIISTSSKQLWQNSDFRNRVLGRMRSEWFRKAASLRALDFWQDDEYLEKFYNSINRESARKKLSEHNRRRWENGEYHRRMTQVRVEQSGKISYIQQLLYRYLDDLNVNYYKEGENTRIGHYVFDCLIKTSDDKRDILIECQGDYWHSLNSNIRNDKAKFTYVDRYFPEYEIMYIWEHEFYTKESVLDRLKLKLGVDVNVIDFNFNDVIIRECFASDYKSFLNAYHYIGKGRGGKCYGAYIDDDLIACCVFSSPLRQNMGRYGDFRELSRFCIHPSYHKKNFASWFISRCLKLINCKVVAYADETLGHVGTIYKASNFIFSHFVAPDYWYVDTGGYVMHKRTLYGQAVNNNLSEGDFAARNGYVKKYGGRKYCYVFS